MSMIVKSSGEDTIFLPARLMTELNLHEGDEVKTIVEGETLRLARLDKFLGLRGAFANDESFDRAMERIDQAWKSWTLPSSV